MRRPIVAVVAILIALTITTSVSPLTIYKGSKVVRPSDYGAVAGITYLYGVPAVAERIPRCSGTLIASDTVLTAGHCVCEARDDGYAINAVFFGNDPRAKSIDPSAVAYFPIKKWWTRYDCGDPARRNGEDLAVLELSRKVEGVDPVAFAPPTIEASEQSARIAGFGAIDAAGRVNDYSKREASVPILSRSCASAADQRKYLCAQDREIVAGVPNHPDTCSGDSGGPLLISPKGDASTLDGNDFLLLGATSRSVPAKTPCGAGSVFERLDSLAQSWIASVRRTYAG